MRVIRSAATAIVGCLVAARIIACSSFSEGPDETPAEAGEASNDTSVVTDAAVDTYVSADAGGCTVVLMDGFNRDSVFDGGPWETITETAGTLSTSTDTPFDMDAGARSLFATIPNDAAAGGAYVYKGLGSAKVVRLSFAVRANLGPGRTLYINTLEMSQATQRLHFLVRPGEVVLQEQVMDGGLETYPVGSDTNQWHQYELTVALDAPARVYVTRDGVKVLDQPLKYPFAPAQAFLKGGVSFVGRGPVATAFIDDIVVCTLAP